MRGIRIKNKDRQDRKNRIAKEKRINVPGPPCPLLSWKRREASARGRGVTTEHDCERLQRGTPLLLLPFFLFFCFLFLFKVGLGLGEGRRREGTGVYF
jgi:hypothetical protein